MRSYQQLHDGALDCFRLGADSFTIFVTNRAGKTGVKSYIKVEYQIGSRYEDINYLIECCLAADGRKPSLEFMLKDVFDGTMVLHAGAFYPGMLLTLVKKTSNKDLFDFYANTRASMRYNLNKLESQ